MKSGYIQRRHLDQALTAAIEDAARAVIPGESPGYEIGKALGYSDGLKAAKEMLKSLDDEPLPEPVRTWHHAPR